MFFLRIHFFVLQYALSYTWLWYSYITLFILYFTPVIGITCFDPNDFSHLLTYFKGYSWIAVAILSLAGCGETEYMERATPEVVVTKFQILWWETLTTVTRCPSLSRNNRNNRYIVRFISSSFLMHACWGKNPEPRTQNPEPRTQNPEPQTPRTPVKF